MKNTLIYFFSLSIASNAIAVANPSCADVFPERKLDELWSTDGGKLRHRPVDTGWLNYRYYKNGGEYGNFSEHIKIAMYRATNLYPDTYGDWMNKNTYVILSPREMVSGTLFRAYVYVFSKIDSKSWIACTLNTTLYQDR